MAASNDQRLEGRARDVERDVLDVVVAAARVERRTIARVGACGESNRIQPKSDIVTSRSRRVARHVARVATGETVVDGKFIDPCVVDGVLVRQYASAEAFAKSTATSTAEYDDDDDDDDDDRVPGTGFHRVGRERAFGEIRRARGRVGTAHGGEASRRDARADDDARAGRGDGLATLLVASSEIASREEGGLVCVMTDLPEVVALARANARENKEENGGRAAAPGALGDARGAMGTGGGCGGASGGDTVAGRGFGADLMYTPDEGVIRALAKTTGMLVRIRTLPPPFAACREHRPERSNSSSPSWRRKDSRCDACRRRRCTRIIPRATMSSEILECWRR